MCMLLSKLFFMLAVLTAKLSHGVDIVFLLIYKLLVCTSEQCKYWSK